MLIFLYLFLPNVFKTVSAQDNWILCILSNFRRKQIIEADYKALGAEAVHHGGVVRGFAGDFRQQGFQIG